MIPYDFDRVIDRSGTCAVKTDLCKALFGNEHVQPLWVADMDFETPPFIREALMRRLEHPIYGYTLTPSSFWEAIIRWQKARHGWDIPREWLCFMPGIVKGIGLVELCFTKPGDYVVIQPPVYHPFRLVSQANGLQVLNNPLILEDGQYKMDVDGLEQLFQQHPCKCLILSNPHNPGGRVWTASELQQLAALCDRYHVLVVSDEIHADMTLYGHRHVPFATVSPQAAQNSITFGAPSKTFNIAGIVSSFGVVPNPEIRERFFKFLHANELDSATFMSTIATEAAFSEEGNAWRVQMLAYLEGNIDYVAQALPAVIPEFKVMKPQASFLVWIDGRELVQKYQLESLPRFFIEAGLGLNDGAMFGEEGLGFMRMNVATPRVVLQQAVDALEARYNTSPKK